MLERAVPSQRGAEVLRKPPISRFLPSVQVRVLVTKPQTQDNIPTFASPFGLMTFATVEPINFVTPGPAAPPWEALATSMSSISNNNTNNKVSFSTGTVDIPFWTLQYQEHSPASPFSPTTIASETTAVEGNNSNLFHLRPSPPLAQASQLPGHLGGLQQTFTSHPDPSNTPNTTTALNSNSFQSGVPVRTSATPPSNTPQKAGPGQGQASVSLPSQRSSPQPSAPGSARVHHLNREYLQRHPLQINTTPSSLLLQHGQVSRLCSLHLSL